MVSIKFGKSQKDMVSGAAKLSCILPSVKLVSTQRSF